MFCDVNQWGDRVLWLNRPSCLVVRGLERWLVRVLPVSLPRPTGDSPCPPASVAVRAITDVNIGRRWRGGPHQRLVVAAVLYYKSHPKASFSHIAWPYVVVIKSSHWLALALHIAPSSSFPFMPQSDKRSSFRMILKKKAIFPICEYDRRVLVSSAMRNAGNLCRV